MGAVLGIRSIINSKSLSGGISGNSSGNTSRYSHTTGSSSILVACILQTIGSVLGAWGWHSTFYPLWFIRLTALSLQDIVPWCFFNQSIPSITSKPSVLRTTKSAWNSTPSIIIFTRGHLRVHLRTALGVQIKRGVGSNTILKLFLSKKQAETNECDVPESNNTVARVEFTRNSPYTTSGDACTSSALTWFTRPCPKFGVFLLGGLEFWGAERPVPEAAILLLATD